MRRLCCRERTVRRREIGQERLLRVVDLQTGYPSCGVRYTGLAGQCNRVQHDRRDGVRYLPERPIPVLRNHPIPIVPAISGIAEIYPVKPTIQRLEHVKSIEAQGDQSHHLPLPDHPL